MKAKNVCWVVMAIALAACSGNDKRQFGDDRSLLGELPVVAHSVDVDGHELTVCDLGLMKDTVSLPLSYWVEDMQVVKLDGRDEALVGLGPVCVSDNYIMVGRAKNVPCKLFRKDGSFVGKVGNIGQGPGEYTMIYDMQIDEKAGHVYLLPWNAKSIFVYNLQGEYLKDIPLNGKYEKLIVPKGKFKVDAEKNRVAVVLLPFDYLPVVAWVQDMEGNFIHEITGKHLKLKPDFSKVNADVFLGAMGQAFFSLSLGMGCLSTYASYFGPDTKLGKTALSVGVIDSMVAILAGLIIFPAAFSVGIQPDAGPSLIFITLPNVFQQAFGSVPFLAMLFSLMFYVLLALAALTSTISLHEVVTAYLNERFDLKRSRAALFVTGFCLVTGVLSSLSLGVWEDKFFGLGFFDLLDFVTAKMMLPLNGLLVCLFVGWYLKKTISYEELTNVGTLKAPYYSVYMFLLKYIVPIAIVLIMVNELGFI